MLSSMAVMFLKNQPNLKYVRPFEKFLSELRDANFDVKITSGGERMTITMDRYRAGGLW